MIEEERPLPLNPPRAILDLRAHGVPKQSRFRSYQQTKSRERGGYGQQHSVYQVREARCWGAESTQSVGNPRLARVSPALRLTVSKGKSLNFFLGPSGAFCNGSSDVPQHSGDCARVTHGIEIVKTTGICFQKGERGERTSKNGFW